MPIIGKYAMYYTIISKYDSKYIRIYVDTIISKYDNEYIRKIDKAFTHLNEFLREDCAE
jgi:hypothetical protein